MLKKFQLKTDIIAAGSMAEKYGKIIISLILALAVLLGAYLGVIRFFVENSSRQVELAVDLNDLKKVAAFEKKPLGPILDKLKELGVSRIGVYEETLPEANALGEIYYASGSGILRLGNISKEIVQLVKAKKIKPDRTYIYIPEAAARKRIYTGLSAAFGASDVKFIGATVLEVDQTEDEIRTIGLGLSEIQTKYLKSKGFNIVPRVWNDPHYHLGNIGQKLALLHDYNLIIFDATQLLGYPDVLPSLASEMKKNQIKYGYIEVIKQDGDRQLRKLMGSETVRVHSVPRDELNKLQKAETIERLVRAVRERSVRLLYLRPFLPPQIDAYPIEYNLNYFKELRHKLNTAGFAIGSTGPEPVLELQAWQIWLLAFGVIIGALFLFELFLQLPISLVLCLLALAGVGLFFLISVGQSLLVQKTMAFLAAVVFPSSAIISTLAKPRKSSGQIIAGAIYLIFNILAETSIGIFLMIGLLADSRFLIGIEVFPSVKVALVLPCLIVLAYFVFKSDQIPFREKIKQYAAQQVSLLSVMIFIVVVGALALLIARSGNFIIPVPAVEKGFRNWLEILLFARPRTKEFLIGYPALFMAGVYLIRGEKKWLWLLAAIGVIAPVSVLNSFSHIHTPLMISIVRSFNGLVLGFFVGLLVWWIVARFKWEKKT